MNKQEAIKDLAIVWANLLKLTGGSSPYNANAQGVRAALDRLKENTKDDPRISEKIFWISVGLESSPLFGSPLLRARKKPKMHGFSYNQYLVEVEALQRELRS